MYKYKCMHLEHVLDFTMLVRKEEMAMCSLCCVLNYDTETAVTYQWQILSHFLFNFCILMIYAKHE